MKRLIGVICVVLLYASVNAADEEPATATATLDEDELGLYNANEDPGTKLHTNFLKVMSAMLVRSRVSKETQAAAKVVMRETLNGQPEAEGYKSYMVTSMLRVINNSTGVQLRTMLTIMQESSPPESPMAVAVKQLLDWLQTNEGRKFIDSVINYVRNLFQTLKRNVSKVVPGSLNKADGVSNSGPTYLPGDDDTIFNVAIFARELGSSRPPPPSNIRHPPNRPGQNRPNHPPQQQQPYPPNHQQQEQHENHRPGQRPHRPPNHSGQQERPGHRPQHPNHEQGHQKEKICFERIPDDREFNL